MILYLIPKKYFFQKGWTGSTSHALGICSALKEKNKNFILVANLFDVAKSSIKIEYFIQHNSLLNIYRVAKNNKIERLIIRYSAKNLIKIYLICLIGRLFKIRVTVEVNTLFGHYQKGYLSIIRFFESFIISIANSIYVVSPGLKNDKAIQMFHKKIFYVPNGFISNRVFEQNKNIIKANSKNKFRNQLKYFGSYKSYYNFNLIYRQLNEDSRYILKLYGNFPFKKDSKRIKYMGKYRNSDLPHLVNHEKDILILPYAKNTIAEYGFPTKISEYLNFNCPIVSSDTGVLNNLLGPIDKNLLYQDGDYRSFEKAIAYASSLTIEKQIKISKHYKILANNLKWTNLINLIINEEDFK